MRMLNGDRKTHCNSAAPIELAGDGRFVLPREAFLPAYVKAFEEGILQERAQQAVESLRSCRVCPRDCEIDRFNNKIGVCKSGRLARVASAFPHFGEEDCLRGWNGSGTIFFGCCNLRCVFCQNFETSQLGDGAEVTSPELARIMLDLQDIGCHNINFVTPEHVVPQILEALVIAVERACACRSSITHRLTTAWKASASWTAGWIFTCPISNFGMRKYVGNIS
jgi:putative pyruvate formate lyase activating enzyme